jgi:SIR2-like domain
MTIKDSLINIFKSRNAGPFLFIGSGFSRRYLNLENWHGLLSRFCVTGKPFDYYLTSADGDYPKAAGLLAEDFHDYWWTADEYKESIVLHESEQKSRTSALRIEICSYLQNIDSCTESNPNYPDELNLLKTLNIDGIITTNWDLFLETIFPDYKVYVGQKELLFSNSQGIGEIYKIHGCSSQPNSLVLTDKDYKEFDDRNAYLAAKLITLFIEHPIVFIGYSMSDKNITGLLKAISLCIGKDKIDKLRKNLIFVERHQECEDQNIAETYHAIDGIQIPITLIKTNDFSSIYEAINETKRKIPARILRYCKEQMYELVQSNEPEKKLCVVDIDNINSKDGIEFLVGVGVIDKHQESISSIGYSSITIKDLISDLLHDSSNYNAEKIINNVLPGLIKGTPNIPIFKYLNKANINNEEQYNSRELGFDKTVKRSLEDFRSNGCPKNIIADFKGKSIADVIIGCNEKQASLCIPWLDKSKIDLDILRNFLVKNEEKMEQKNYKYSSNFKKLAALYDKLKWGW